jgi:hypothetical protein
MTMPMPHAPAAHLPKPPQLQTAHAAAPGCLVHRATPLPVDSIGALEAQINQLRNVAEVLRQQLEDTCEDRDRWRQRAQHLMLAPEVLSQSPQPWWKRLGIGWLHSRRPILPNLNIFSGQSGYPSGDQPADPPSKSLT